MVFIGLLGKKCSGKDTAASILITKYNFTRLAFADPIKNICRELFNFSYNQLYNNKETIDEYWGITPRKTFQFIGTDLFRNQINEILPNVKDNFWVLCLERKYKDIISKDPHANIIVTDVRYQNELDMIHNNGGIIIKINRESLSEITDNHESEKHIDNINNYDYCINNNNSVENLFLQIINIVDELK